MGDSLESTDQPSADAENVVICDYNAFTNYLRKAITIFFEEELNVSAFNLALDDRSSQECIKKFIGDPQVSALYIQRCNSKGKCTFYCEIACVQVKRFSILV